MGVLGWVGFYVWSLDIWMFVFLVLFRWGQRCTVLFVYCKICFFSFAPSLSLSPSFLSSSPFFGGGIFFDFFFDRFLRPFRRCVACFLFSFLLSLVLSFIHSFTHHSAPFPTHTSTSIFSPAPPSSTRPSQPAPPRSTPFFPPLDPLPSAQKSISL